MTIDQDRLNRTVEAVWRIESAQIIAVLTRMTRDVALAEEIAQDALVIALEQWPQAGVPDRPGPWLMATAKHRAIDAMRRRATYDRKLQEVGRLQPPPVEDPDPDDVIADDLLRLIFTACHPALPAEGRIALTLRLLGGLSTDQIARAFMTPEATVAQRIVRAKRTLADKQIPYEIPTADQLQGRLTSVLEVVYLIFNEGYSATAGDDWTRPEMCREAMRLGRLLASLMPDEAEVHGLSALMEIQASRIAARTGPDGAPVLLMDQNRRLWDRLLIRRGLAALDLARELGTAGQYTIQAEIAACHARAYDPADTDWPRIAALYTVLAYLAPSPVIEINRAVAVGMAEGPQRGLNIADAVAGHAALRHYPQLPAVRGDLLTRLGRHDEAREAFTQAAALTRNAAERALFQRRATELTSPQAQ
jgi:RNA polymerase sigma factor (sigma-70 family)